MSTYTKRSSARRSDDTMDDDAEDKDDTKRKSRNLSEKKRRDQFNLLVNELSSMVSTGARKMDKSTVLRSTISFLKNHNEIAIRSRAHEIQEDWKPAFLSNEEFTHLILEALDGFIVVFSAAGHVHYVSESVTALLGHLPSELLNTSVYELVWDEEQAALYQALVGNGAGSNSSGSGNGTGTVIGTGTGTGNTTGTGTGPDGQLSFQAHLRRGGGGPATQAHHHQQQQTPDGTDTTNDCYELVNFVGYLRTDVDMLENASTIGGTTDSNRFSGYSGEADTRLFVGTGRLQTPQLIREMSLVDAAVISSNCATSALNTSSSGGRSNPGEFTSRHSLEWKFLFLDHRAPPIIGYLPFEVLGTSGYDYYHVDDLDQVVSCHEALMQKGEGTSCYYRFLTKGQQWIWLQTRFYITYHQWNSKPEFIVCTHRVVSYVDVMKQSRKKSDDSKMSESNITLVDSFSVPTSTPGGGGGGSSSTSSPWGQSSHRTSTQKSNSGRHRRAPSGAPSDCTSMSADSPTSRQSQSSQHQQIINSGNGRHSRLSNHNQIASQVQVQVACGLSNEVIFAEPQQHIQQQQQQQPTQQLQNQNQFVQQTVITGFPTPTPITVLSPLLPADNNSLVLMNSPTTSEPISSASSPIATHLQAQLQRKHAELQAIIDQQQAELRKVSEQLLMARLGLLATPSTTMASQQPPQQPHQPQLQHIHGSQEHSIMNYGPQHPVSNSYICNSNVSSTTSHQMSSTSCRIPTEGICVSPIGGQISVAIPVVSVTTHAHAPHDHHLQHHAQALQHQLQQQHQHRRTSDETSTMALSQQQAQMLYAAPASNNPEHK